MTLIVVLSSPNTTPAPDAAPRRIVNRFDAITLDVVYIERDEATAIPYFWMEDVPIGEFESAVAEIADIELVERYERTEEGAFYRRSRPSASGLDPEGKADTQTCSVRSIYRSIVSLDTCPAVPM